MSPHPPTNPERRFWAAPATVYVLVFALAALVRLAYLAETSIAIYISTWPFDTFLPMAVLLLGYGCCCKQNHSWTANGRF